MGHGFLNSAFVAEYEAGERPLQVFIIDAADEPAADKMLQDYLALVERKGGSHLLKEGTYRFKDPYHSSRGMMNVKRVGLYLLGLATDNEELSDAMLEQIEEELE
jgi:hypothetical protein